MSARSWRGFTLIELLVAMVIGLFLLTGIITVFLANQNAYRHKIDLDAAQDAFRFAHFTVTRLVRSADDYEIAPAAGGDDMLRLTIRPGALEGGVFGCDGASELPDPSTIEIRRVGGELRCDGDAVVEGLGRFSVEAFGDDRQAVQVTLEMQRNSDERQARLETRFVASLRNRIAGRVEP